MLFILLAINIYSLVENKRLVVSLKRDIQVLDVYGVCQEVI